MTNASAKTIEIKDDTNCGATLDQITEATGWRKHTPRGFISILGSKGGMKVTSTKRKSDGARVYEA